MKRLLLLALIPFSLSLNLAAQELPKEEWFDFWVGTWEVSWEESDGKRGSGTNTIEKTLDGKVIQENFRITKGNNAGFKGTSISVYNVRNETWHQAWADNQGGYYDFYGEKDGEKRIFRTHDRTLPDGSVLIQRMVFYDIDENSLTWDWESSRDGGETWQLNWRIDYRRINE